MSKQFVVFSISKEELGIEITKVKEILNPMQIFKVPNTPDYIEGIFNLRGHVHIIFDLRQKLKIPPEQNHNLSKIVIVNHPELKIGFFVDSVNEIIKVEDEDIQSKPKSIMLDASDFISGVAKVKEKLVILMNIDNIILSASEAA